MRRRYRILDAVVRETPQYSPKNRRYLELSKADSLQVSDLDEGLHPGEPKRLGYTLKALRAALWSLAHAPSFREDNPRAVHQRGDADTNAGATGALLGAQFGYSGIPRESTDSLHAREDLDWRVERWVTLTAREG